MAWSTPSSKAPSNAHTLRPTECAHTAPYYFFGKDETFVPLETGTAGLHVPTGEVRPFPSNTSDALTSGGTYAIAGAVERMVQHVIAHCGQEPACVMTGGAGWKMMPSMTRPFELVENLIFDGLLHIAHSRFAAKG